MKFTSRCWTYQEDIAEATGDKEGKSKQTLLEQHQKQQLHAVKM